MAAFLESLAARAPAPSAGAAVAVCVGLAAALVGMAARAAVERLEDAGAIAARADDLRARVLAAAGEDARAYADVLLARARPAQPDPSVRQRAVRDALSQAAGIPLSIAEIGAEIGGLAARLAAEGKPDLRGEALTAVWLAQAGVRAAAELVVIDLPDAGAADERLGRAKAARRRAAEAARRAASAGSKS